MKMTKHKISIQGKTKEVVVPSLLRIRLDYFRNNRTMGPIKICEVISRLTYELTVSNSDPSL